MRGHRGTLRVGENTGLAGAGAAGRVVLAWGCGGRGQLGSGTPADSVVPRIVEGSLRGRQILQVGMACMHRSSRQVNRDDILGTHLDPAGILQWDPSHPGCQPAARHAKPYLWTHA